MSFIPRAMTRVAPKGIGGSPSCRPALSTDSSLPLLLDREK